MTSKTAGALSVKAEPRKTRRVGGPLLEGGEPLPIEKRARPNPRGERTHLRKVMESQPTIEEVTTSSLKSFRWPELWHLSKPFNSLSFGGASRAQYCTVDAMGNKVRNNTEEQYWAMLQELPPLNKKGNRMQPFQAGEYWSVVSCMSSFLDRTEGYARACPGRFIMFWAQGASPPPCIHTHTHTHTHTHSFLAPSPCARSTRHQAPLSLIGGTALLVRPLFDVL